MQLRCFQNIFAGMTSSCLYIPVSVIGAKCKGCAASRIIRTIFIRKGIICHGVRWQLSPPQVADHAKIGVCLPKGRPQFSKWTCSILILRVRQPASYQTSSNRAVLGQALAVFLCPGNSHLIPITTINSLIRRKEAPADLLSEMLSVVHLLSARETEYAPSVNQQEACLLMRRQGKFRHFQSWQLCPLLRQA